MALRQEPFVNCAIFFFPIQQKTGSFLQSPVQLPFRQGIQTHGRQGEGKPQQAVGRADLAQEVSRHGPVVPDAVIPVHQQARGQLHRRDHRRSQDHPAGEPTHGAEQKEAQTAGGKHAHMAAAPPQHLQTNIDAAPPM